MHHLNYAEVLPLAPALPAAGEGLAALFPLLAALFSLGLLYLWRFTVGAVIVHLANLLDRVAVHAFGRSRHLFGPVSSGLRELDGAVQHTLGTIYRHSERAAVYLFHKSMAGFAAVGHELWALGYDIGGALERIVHNTIPAKIDAALAGVAHALHSLRAAELRLAHQVVRPLERYVHREVAHAELEFDAFGRRIARVGSRVGRLERAGQAELSRLSRLERLLTAGAFAGLVAVALRTLELEWLRCPSLTRLGRRFGCRGFGLLESLLVDAIDVLVIADVCQITRAMIAAAESPEGQAALRLIVQGTEDLIGCLGADRPPAVPFRAAALPPLQQYATLPA